MACIPPNPRRVGYIVSIHGPLDGPLYMSPHINQQGALNFCSWMWTQEAERRQMQRGCKRAAALDERMTSTLLRLATRPCSWVASAPPTPACTSVGGAPAHMRSVDRRSKGWRRELMPCNRDELIRLFFWDELTLEYSPLWEQLYPIIPQPNTSRNGVAPSPNHPSTNQTQPK